MSAKQQSAQKALSKQEQSKQRQNFQVIENNNNNPQASYQQFQVQQQQFAAQAAAEAYNQAMQQFSPANNNQFNPFAQLNNQYAQPQAYNAVQQQEQNIYANQPQYAEYNNEELDPEIESRRARAQYVGNIITALYEIIAERKNANPEASYTAHLHQEGSAALARKMMSDAANATFTLLSAEESKYAVDDASNVIYDLLVMLEAKGYDITDLCGMLEQKIEESEGDIGALVDGNFQDNPRYYQASISSQEQSESAAPRKAKASAQSKAAKKAAPRKAKASAQSKAAKKAAPRKAKASAQPKASAQSKASAQPKASAQSKASAQPKASARQESKAASKK